ncbi:MAG: hypothetical protein NZ853_02240 [Leptospiraceae bacterium]|nr:hypothetical protein [Leptospiraceae bacterium]MDW7975954.1 hypothetical protein [Leptospiraceae bacterium]
MMRIIDYQLSIGNIQNVSYERYSQQAIQTYKELQNLIEAKNTNVARDQVVVAMNSSITENKMNPYERNPKEIYTREKNPEKGSETSKIYYSPVSPVRRSFPRNYENIGTQIDLEA